MFATPEQFAATNKANVEALLTVANSAFASAERLAALNLNTARTFLEDSMASTKALMGIKDVQYLVNLQTTLAQPEPGRSLQAGRSPGCRNEQEPGCCAGQGCQVRPRRF